NGAAACAVRNSKRSSSTQCASPPLSPPHQHSIGSSEALPPASPSRARTVMPRAQADAASSGGDAAGPVGDGAGVGDGSGGARVVVAYDAPESCPRETLTEGFDLIGLVHVDMSAVASFHLDEDAVWNDAVRLALESGAEAAEDRLGESDLLWYDATELPSLLDERG